MSTNVINRLNVDTPGKGLADERYNFLCGDEYCSTYPDDQTSRNDRKEWKLLVTDGPCDFDRMRGEGDDEIISPVVMPRRLQEGTPDIFTSGSINVTIPDNSALGATHSIDVDLQ